MKRAPIVLAATAVGVAGTLGFKAHDSTTVAAATTSTSSGTTTSGSASSDSSSTTTASASGSSSTTTASSTTKTVTSDVISTIYGNVELKVTFTNGKITAIENVQLPANDPHSVQINDYAGPQLKQSALSHADGTVDAVSGATYTTNGYEQALQSALDKAGLATTSTSSSTS